MKKRVALQGLLDDQDRLGAGVDDPPAGAPQDPAGDPSDAPAPHDDEVDAVVLGYLDDGRGFGTAPITAAKDMARFQEKMKELYEGVLTEAKAKLKEEHPEMAWTSACFDGSEPSRGTKIFLYIAINFIRGSSVNKVQALDLLEITGFMLPLTVFILSGFRGYSPPFPSLPFD